MKNVNKAYQLVSHDAVVAIEVNVCVCVCGDQMKKNNIGLFICEKDELNLMQCCVELVYVI